jgi:hypothetical protein
MCPPTELVGFHWNGRASLVLKMVRGCPPKFGLQEGASKTGPKKGVARRETKEISFALNIGDVAVRIAGTLRGMNGQQAVHAVIMRGYERN